MNRLVCGTCSRPVETVMEITPAEFTPAPEPTPDDAFVMFTMEQMVGFGFRCPAGHDQRATPPRVEEVPRGRA